MDPADPSYVKHIALCELNYGVRIFWDLNQNPLQNVDDASTIFFRIDESLKKADPKYFIRTVTIYGDFTKYQGCPDIFKRTGFNFALTVKHMPVREQYCSQDKNPECKPERRAKDLLAELCLAQDIDFLTTYFDPPFPILLITSDPDFENHITTLATRGFIMMLACRENTPPCVGRSAYFKWFWNKMMDGEDPVEPAGHYYPDK